MLCSRELLERRSRLPQARERLGEPPLPVGGNASPRHPDFPGLPGAADNTPRAMM
jgi:hypothetical protein